MFPTKRFGSAMFRLLTVAILLWPLPGIAQVGDLAEVIKKVEELSGWTFVKRDSVPTVNGSAFIFNSHVGRGMTGSGLQVKIDNLLSFKQEMELKGTPRVSKAGSGYFFPEYEKNAAREIEKRTGWELEINETEMSIEFEFKNASHIRVRLQQPSEVLAQIILKGTPRISGFRSVFFPDHERSVGQYVAQELGFSVSYDESPTWLRCIFVEPSTHAQFETINSAEALLESLTDLGAPKLREKLLALVSDAKALAKAAGWQLGKAKFQDGALKFFYAADQSWYQTTNPKSILKKIAGATVPTMKNGRLAWTSGSKVSCSDAFGP